jgi:hypothetical protein
MRWWRPVGLVAVGFIKGLLDGCEQFLKRLEIAIFGGGEGIFDMLIARDD